VAAAFGAKAELDYKDGYPPTVNDPAMTALVRAAVTKGLGAAAVVEQDLTMGGEDMSYVLQRVPGCYLVVGSRSEAKGLVHPHHSPRFDFDEDALAVGVDAWLAIAERFLE